MSVLGWVRMKGCSLLFPLGFLLAAGPLCAAQTQPAGAHAKIVPSVRALRLTSPIDLDGRLVEPAWNSAQPAIGFKQYDPDEGKPETEKTDVRVLYDDQALYIGARMYDREPKKIRRGLTRRDDSEIDADWISIYLDPRHDHLTGAHFQVTSAGSLSDSVIYNDTFEDSSWDAVWDAKVTVDAQGWVAEIRIPFSQLRFSTGDHQTWGFNIQRYIQRKNETDWWELVPKKESGLASRMGHLEGLDEIPSHHHLDLLPYATGRAEYIQPSPGDPFSSGRRYFGNAGLDIKLGLTSNLTLDGTINPDFGQVEVDPAVVNLTAFETFYEEKRPFFLEGANIFGNFGRSGSNSFFGFNRETPSLFYSRRIGRTPQGSASGDFIDEPSSTTILGASKLTGKTASGWSIGVLDAVTASEFARVDTVGVRSEVEVEPATNYLVGRLKRDLGQRASVGFLFTSVERDLSTASLSDLLDKRAYTFGADGHLLFGPKHDWAIVGSLVGSWLQGSPAAMLRLQTDSARYFQRPDATQVHLNPNATTLGGWNGQLDLNKNSGDVTVNAALWAVSPGFESNDLGYMTTADRAGAHGVLTWRKQNPDRWTRSRTLLVANWWTWNFKREMQGEGYFVLASATLHNYWNVNAVLNFLRPAFDDRLTRGGPSVRRPGEQNYSLGIQSDSRKRISLGVNGNYGRTDAGGFSSDYSVSVAIKPSSSLTVSTGPEISLNHTIAQYVTTTPDPLAVSTFGNRYVFADLNEPQVSMTTRINYVFTPKVSLQMYIQPLLTTGQYHNFNELARPHTFDFLRYGADAGTLAYDAGRQIYTADPDGPGPAAPFSFANPDFNFKSLRVNAIFRWEWRLGSTLFLVWTQERQDNSHPGDFTLGRDVSSLFQAHADNVFAVKLAYWLTR
ncbi:MAG: DUF5916 domain-containing protein [Acidobacteriota bacterium]|jgi:hypothetical protein